MAKEENLVSGLQTSCSLSVTVLNNFNAKINFANVNSKLRYTNVKGESATYPETVMHVSDTYNILKCK